MLNWASDSVFVNNEVVLREGRDSVPLSIYDADVQLHQRRIGRDDVFRLLSFHR